MSDNNFYHTSHHSDCMGIPVINTTGKASDRVIAILAVVPFFGWLYRYINLDFFYDEVYSLVHYVFVPVKKTVARYQDSNNHFLSNLFNNIYVKLIGEESVFTLMDHPYIIRSLQVLYVIITLIVFYRLCRKFFNQYIALFAIILLTTSFPYYNFAVQIRGYNLSILLLCIVLYYLWSFERSCHWIDGLILAGASALFIYSMPSNLYTLCGIGFFHLFKGGAHYILQFGKKPSQSSKWKNKPLKGRKTFFSENRDAVILFFLFLGILLSLLLYSPVITEMLNDPNMKSKGFFYKPTLYKMMPSVLHAFISWRYLIVLLAAAGLIYCAFAYNKCEKDFIQRSIFCLVVLVTPFILSFIRGDRPYDRFFINLIPVFCLFISLFLSFLFINILESKGLYIIGVLFVYAHLTFAFGMKHIAAKLMDDIKYGHQSVSLLYNYFQAYYAPLKLLRFFTENYPEAQTSVPFVVHYCDRAAIPVYLRKVNQPMADVHAMDEITKHFDKIYVLSALPNIIQKEYKMRFPDFELKRLNDQLQFHNVFLMRKNSIITK